ncbi:MAG: DNA-processing protein DprA [Bacteroidia bacterium]
MKLQDEVFWIALTMIPGVGPVMAKHLVSYCGSAEEVFRQKKTKLMRIPGIGEKTAESIAAFHDFSEAEQEIVFAQKHKIKILPYVHTDYPERLKNCEDGPVVLYHLGETNLNAARILAIVGTRKNTDYGRAFTEQLLNELQNSGCLIVSGMAYGIDIIAHKAALQNNLPTVGVMAHGLHTLYPSAHKSTAKKMIENGGGLLTEFRSTQNTDKENFPKRNRIVAGMCDATVVIETAFKGGAIITAELANDYNRDVFAVPGRANDTMSEGCNQLIRKNKAALIQSGADLLEMMGWQPANNKRTAKTSMLLNLTIEEQSIVNLFNGQPKLGIDEISMRLESDSGTVALTLLDMEFKGIIRSLPGKYYQLSST